jgi:hypothetical protein
MVDPLTGWRRTNGMVEMANSAMKNAGFEQNT